MNIISEIDDDAIQPLLPTITSRSPVSSRPKPARCYRMYYRNLHVFFKSKAACMLLFWNIFVGATYGTIIFSAIPLGINFRKKTKGNAYTAMYLTLGIYAIVAFIQLICYPIGGLLADIWYGRHKIVTLSIVKICCGFGFLCIAILLSHEDPFIFQDDKKKIGYSLIVLSILLLVLGFTGFQANAVQFGLDQLLEASSEELSVFLHWYVWTDNLGQLIMRVLSSLVLCFVKVKHSLGYIPIPLFVILLATLIVGCYKREWFHSEPHTRNPYGIIYRVLKFAAKHDRPLRRSAMTYCDDEMPTRLDYAKERFGGPFKTDVVEDVKTFLRILVMLLAIGSIYIIQVLAIYLFPLYGLYMGPTNSVHDDKEDVSCKLHDWLIFETGNLSYLLTVLFLPLYIVFIHPHINRIAPKILVRLGIGIVLMLGAILSISLIYLGGHYHHKHSHHNNARNTCLFEVNFKPKDYETLGLSSYLLSIPNMFMGLASPLIYITILEFISAQSPHTMKGLLLGVFYAVRGFFIMLGCVVVYPFSTFPKENHLAVALFDCGFSYCMVQVIIGCIGLIIFVVASRWYRLRVRDDPPYDHMYAEVFYSRHRRQANRRGEERCGVMHIQNSILYGTSSGT